MFDLKNCYKNWNTKLFAR